MVKIQTNSQQSRSKKRPPRIVFKICALLSNMYKLAAMDPIVVSVKMQAQGSELF